MGRLGKLTIDFFFFRFGNQTVSFTHKYTLTNAGPSPTIGTKSILIYIPKKENIKNEVKSLGNGITCTTKTTTGEEIEIGATTKNAISCENSECVHYECIIDAGWEKDDNKVINIDMNFLGEDVDPDDFSDFTYVTAAQIDGKGK